MLVSVVIPTLNEAENIAAAVDAARRGYTLDEVEVVVADGGSSDGTRDRVPEGAICVEAPRGRARQLNAGAAASHGEILLFCHADSRLPAGWRDGVIEALADPAVSGGSFQTLILPATDPILWFRNQVRMRARWQIVFGDQCQFCRRETFERIGGFPDLILMEDVELSRRLHDEGRLVRLMPRVITSSRRFQELGTLRQIWINYRGLTGYLKRGWTPEDVAAHYRSSRERFAEGRRNG